MSLKRFIRKLIWNQFKSAEMAVLNALNNKKWEKRYVSGIADETGLDEDKVQSVIKKYPTLIHEDEYEDDLYYITDDVSVCLALKKRMVISLPRRRSLRPSVSVRSMSAALLMRFLRRLAI